MDEGILLESKSQVHGHTLPVGKRSPEQNFNPIIMKSFGASSNGITDFQSSSRAQSPGSMFFIFILKLNSIRRFEHVKNS